MTAAIATPSTAKTANSAAALCTRDQAITDAVASTEPAVITSRGSRRSISQPTPTPATAEVASAIEAASDTSARERPSSACIGASRTANAYIRTP